MGRKAHTDDTKNLLKYQHEIPFMVWCSDKYIKSHPQIIAELHTSLDRPAMSDNVCQLLFHLAKLETPYYKANRDLLSPSFTPQKRMVNGK